MSDSYKQEVCDTILFCSESRYRASDKDRIEYDGMMVVREERKKDFMSRPFVTF